MTHYEVLGVGRRASADEIRRAYLDAARRSHPDVAGAAGDATMRDLNSAWAVLGDAEARRAYDLSLPDGPAAPPRVDINRPVDRPFVPYHAEDEDDDDTWRYVDDETDPETAPGAALQLGPMVVVAVGLALVGAGLVTRAAPLAALGGVAVGVGLVAFLVVPLMVMARASTVEHRRERDRDAARRNRRPPRA
ncbi:MAG: J domain-containing protein [Acidimicrobiales bacterium]